jgi:glycosyltransferase involved in cell wall biosynthesis
LNEDDQSVCRIYVDARSLQDARFRDRGIGQYASSVLAGVHEFAPAGVTPHLIACVDRSLPSLEPNVRALFAAEQALSAAMDDNSMLLEPSPMTHSPHPLRNALENPTIHTAAIVHDFIPLNFPADYLADAPVREDYLTNLAVLHDYDGYITNSEFTSMELQRNLKIGPRNCYVSGVPVRESVISVGGRAPDNDHYCLVVGGGDKRKNVRLPIRAHAKSTLLNASNVVLKIIGCYSEDARSEFRALHLREGGTSHLLKFIENVSDAELGTLYQRALVTVCPSRAEGFSIPVVEANANGCPVVVADCPAQAELMPLAAYQFDPDDDGRVRTLMESFIDPAFGSIAIEQQGNFWMRFQAAAVQQRFWSAFFALSENDARTESAQSGSPYVARKTKPRLAIASPVPPDRSGVADYTMATMAAVAKHAEIDLYTETQGRILNRAFNSIHPLSVEPYISRSYDGVISVLGNSHLHLGTFDLLLNYGGGAIAHDARMLHFYFSLLGSARTQDVAARELGRLVTMEEIQGWITNQRTMPILFLGEILEASQPVFVHSPTTREIIRNLYDRETIHLPFATYRAQSREFAGAPGRARARALLGIEEKDRLLVCLGDLVPDKAPEECLWTASMLHEWGVPVCLAFVGNSQPEIVAYLRSMANNIGLTDKIRFTGGIVDERIYQAYLAAADAAIQLRIYGFGGLSGAMLDGIAAGVPTIANAHLAEAMESPSYVARIPDGLSPVLAAEELMEIFNGDTREDFEDERKAFLEAHSVDAYAERLLNGMGFA